MERDRHKIRQAHQPENGGRTVRRQGVCVGVVSSALIKGGNRYSRDRGMV